MNKLPIEKRAQILGLLVEGNSLRAASRLAQVSINTVTKLLVDAGCAAAAYQDKALRNLPCKRVQVDEIWSFVGCKQKNVTVEKEGVAGDIWTWTAICADTKLVPSFFVGSRDAKAANQFIDDLKQRLANRIQLTSDGHHAYLDAVAGAFEGEIDYAMLIKTYGEVPETQRRYSPPVCVGCHGRVVTGNPDGKHISTSFAERQNLTMRMSMRRFTRLTNAFSKKIENHLHAVALHFMWYNFGRIHKTLKVSPAMAAGVETRLWEMADLVKIIESHE